MTSEFKDMMEIVTISPEMVQVKDISEVSETDELYYELGYLDVKVNENITAWHYDNKWVRTGKFIKVKNVKELLEKDEYLTDEKYLRHHNFMVIKR